MKTSRALLAVLAFVGLGLVASGADVGYIPPPGGGGGGGTGDMSAATYDPQGIAADAFDVDNHTDGTTNKVYTAAEKTKLAGIATGATANSSDATLLARANHTGTQSADTITDGTTNHAFTAADDTKLAGIEAGADVTDATNVNAAGAVMESDTSTASMSFVVDEDDMSSNSATKVPTQQSVKAYVDANSGGSGDVTQSGDNDFTGTNTHAGLETFGPTARAIYATESGAAVGAAVTFDLANGDYQTALLDQNVTVTLSASGAAVRTLVAKFIQDSSGGNSVSLASGPTYNDVYTKSAITSLDSVSTTGDTATFVGFQTDDGGTTWSVYQLTSSGITSVVEDTTPQLGGDLDLNSHVITGLVIGTNVQAYDADLTTWAGVTPGTGVATALAVNTGSAGAVVVQNGALGTPSSGSAANLTSFPTLNQNTTGSAATLTTTRTLWGQNFNGSGNVTGSLTSVTDITGGASNMVITSGTGNSRTLALRTTTSGGTATTAVTIGATQVADFANAPTVASVAVPTISSTSTLTNKRITARVGSTTSSATPTINIDTVDIYKLTAQAAAITSMTTNLSGTPTDGQQLEVLVTDNGTARAITWGASFGAGPVALPTTTVISKTLRVYLQYDSVRAVWVCMYSGSDT